MQNSQAMQEMMTRVGVECEAATQNDKWIQHLCNAWVPELLLVPFLRTHTHPTTQQIEQKNASNTLYTGV